MAHLGLYCPAETGHLHTMLPLGQALQQRGHQITFYGILDAQPQVSAAGIDFHALGEQVFPQGSTATLFAELGELSGIPALRYTIQWLQQTATVFLEEAPLVLKQAGIEALVVDQITPEGGTVADYLEIPFITVCSALPCNQEAGVPPFFTTWPYQSSRWAYLRNWLTYQLTNPLGASLRNLRLKYRQKWQLPPENSSDSQLAILSHQPAAFEYPRQHLPQWFHFTGPYHNQASRKSVDFPWEQLSDKPLIYASFGTLLSCSDVLGTIAAVCSKLDVQLVISLGGSAQPEDLPKLQGNPLVVSYAPQLDLLQKTTLIITHAGMNTALEALTYGVPIVAIPISNDQPGIATRIAWVGAGELLPLGQLDPERLFKVVQTVLKQSTYKENALRLKDAIQKAGGVNRAVDIVEQVISTGKPVCR